MSNQSETLLVELLDESVFQCDCCAKLSRKIWGLVNQGDNSTAAYWLHWTPDHLDVSGANLDIICGDWGDDTTTKDRVAISLLYRISGEEPPAIMIIDAANRVISQSGLVCRSMRRDEVIGTPLADHVFAIVDAIWEQDHRFF